MNTESLQNEPEASAETPNAETFVEQAEPGPSATHALEEENASLKEKLLRSMAEVENTRRRFQRDQEETAKYAVTGFAKDIVNVVENLQRASASIPEQARTENPMLKTLGDGVELTLRELLGMLERHAIRRIDPMGEKFDHNYHQAVAQIEGTDKPAGTVVQVLQAGYVIHDRLLKPAMVGVAKGDVAAKLDTQA